MDSYARKAEEERKRKEGLNPYCSGQWTRTADDVAFTLMATES